MKVCYIDESGTGTEPVAVMTGIVVDSQRMHVTKDHWDELMDKLSAIVGKKLRELHTRDFYAGGGVWKPMDGPQRAQIVSEIVKWLADRKHHLVYTSVVKADFEKRKALGKVPAEVNTVWKFLGFHLILAMQRTYQTEEKTKGHTIFIFDNEERQQLRFVELIQTSPAWSYSYYTKGKKDPALSHIIDVPYFGDSADVPLLQVADLAAFFFRRYAEIEENLVPPKYADEQQKVGTWVKALATRSIGRSSIYPRTGRCECADLFFDLAPAAIRAL